MFVPISELKGCTRVLHNTLVHNQYRLQKLLKAILNAPHRDVHDHDKRIMKIETHIHRLIHWGIMSKTSAQW